MVGLKLRPYMGGGYSLHVQKNYFFLLLFNPKKYKLLAIQKRNNTSTFASKTTVSLINKIRSTLFAEHRLITCKHFNRLNTKRAKKIEERKGTQASKKRKIRKERTKKKSKKSVV